MVKVSIKFSDQNDDRFGNTDIEFTKEVEELDLYEWLYFLGQASRGIGFTYVEGIGADVGDDVKWGDV